MINNGWNVIEFTDTQGFSEEEIATAKKLMAGGFSIRNPEKGVGAEYLQLTNNGFDWGQIRLEYEKSMVSCPFFVEEGGEIYLLECQNYQPASHGLFGETARGFSTMVDGRIETTMETAMRVIRQKTNLPVKPEMIFRIASPINPDPSWNKISKGLSFVGCSLPLDWFIKKDGRYKIDEKFLIKPDGVIPNVIGLTQFLDFLPVIESPEIPECGLSQHAVLALHYFLMEKNN